MVSVDRWSLYGGALFSTAEVDNEPAYCGFYRQVFFICEWSLKQVYCIHNMHMRRGLCNGIQLRVTESSRNELENYFIFRF